MCTGNWEIVSARAASRASYGRPSNNASSLLSQRSRACNARNIGENSHGRSKSKAAQTDQPKANLLWFVACCPLLTAGVMRDALGPSTSSSVRLSTGRKAAKQRCHDPFVHDSNVYQRPGSVTCTTHRWPKLPWPVLGSSVACPRRMSWHTRL